MLSRFFFDFSVHFDYNVTWHRVHWVYAVWGLHSFFVGLWFLPHLEKFQILVLNILFQLHPLSALFIGLQWHEYWIFCYSPTGPWFSVHFLFSVYFLLVRLDSMYCSSFNFTNLFLCPLHSFVELIYWAILVIVFSVLKFSFSSLYFVFTCWDFFHLFQACL